MRKNIQIAIDGPGGSGKSTVARSIAYKLGFTYIDTGAMYRAIALCCLQNGVDLQNELSVTNILPNINIDIDYINGVQQVFLNKTNVSDKIRTMEVSQATSVVSTYQSVRDKLLDAQRNMAKSRNVIMDGRDIGTVVLPQADIKFFLTASVLTRAKRRQAELERKGEPANLNFIKKEIEERDNRDITRDISPLVQAEDAFLIDTSNMTIQDVVDKIIYLISKLDGLD